MVATAGKYCTELLSPYASTSPATFSKSVNWANSPGHCGMALS